MKLTNFDKIGLVLIFLINLLILVGLFYLFHYFSLSPEKAEKAPLKQSVISAGVTPHHLLAEEIIEEFFTHVASEETPETVVLLSPDHFQTGSIVGDDFITLQLNTQYLGKLKVAGFLIENLAIDPSLNPIKSNLGLSEKDRDVAPPSRTSHGVNNLTFNNQAIILDHGITNLIPFIEKHFPQAKIAPFIIPVTVSKEAVEQFSISLSKMAPEKTIVIASVDFSHELPPQAAEFHDIKSIRTLINFEKENFENLDVDSWQALYVARAFAHLRKKDLPKIIGHTNSANLLKTATSADTTSYFSVLFEEKNNVEFLNIRSKIQPEKNEAIQETERFKTITVLFVGDIMLDRGVEYLIKRNSVFYPFEKIRRFLKGIDIVFGNLEGPIVKNPPHFPDDSLRFAFAPEVVEGLAFGNFNLLSLANNHTLNMKEEGLEETRKFLKEQGIDFVGEPVGCSKEFGFESDGINPVYTPTPKFLVWGYTYDRDCSLGGGVKFLAFNKTFPFNCKDKEIVDTVKTVRLQNPTSFLVINLHWGNEYQPQSSFQQQELARKIISAGADLIIGHHPHVVQEVEVYQGKLIFYSLGNFIFDQYFSKETQQGLAVGLEIWPEKLIYCLFPIQSKLSQPFLMKQKETKKFLEKLAQGSDQSLFEQIKRGIIKIERLR